MLETAFFLFIAATAPDGGTRTWFMTDPMTQQACEQAVDQLLAQLTTRMPESRFGATCVEMPIQLDSANAALPTGRTLA